MVKGLRGSSFIESIVSILVILTIINPFYISLISILKLEKKLEIYKKLEEEVGKMRGEYKLTHKISKNNINYEVELRESYIIENLYKVDIQIRDRKSDIKRGTVLYVYKQK